MLGRKSKTKSFIIPNNQNPSNSYNITVQYNKNGGICDIIPRIGNVFTDFQGKQLNDDITRLKLTNVLHEELNSIL